MNLVNITKLSLIGASMLFSSFSFAADIDMNADTNDVAIKGYDTVSYFTQGRPVQGNAKYTATFKNTIYQFASVGNRDKFKKNPHRYAPQYGGYCAMGVALEKKLDTDPLAFRIVDNKLYLNLNKAVQKKWLTDIDGNIDTAESNWPEIKGLSVAEVNAD